MLQHVQYRWCYQSSSRPVHVTNRKATGREKGYWDWSPGCYQSSLVHTIPITRCFRWWPIRPSSSGSLEPENNASTCTVPVVLPELLTACPCDESSRNRNSSCLTSSDDFDVVVVLILNCIYIRIWQSILQITSCHCDGNDASGGLYWKSIHVVISLHSYADTIIPGCSSFSKREV